MCITEIDDIKDRSYFDSSYYPKLIRLYLIDNHQRNLEFEDVGSGIGYVLPALASLAQDGISLIQQPELHLHPALQSKLGDVIVVCPLCRCGDTAHKGTRGGAASIAASNSSGRTCDAAVAALRTPMKNRLTLS
jgi:predicted ATP-dependent endonuclease of OLD family